MNRYGFEKMYIDSFIKSIFVYTGRKKKLTNYFKLCKNDLILGEQKRKIIIFKKLIKTIIPNFILKFIEKNKKVEY